ncbi:MAG: DUF2207 domain-containing protein [Propionicimonas sp.]|uniref:DUF2207 domain-containing protein n=1 Tax=Propionicimonas sp. TaxID=1955623 RepID=UPI002B20CC72|nr:DUF2207 domain-containing protein [Propionicimonas sp.]MEA4945078.1 DUF2207 domain-containing protein [Propionicimonas sp.]
MTKGSSRALRILLTLLAGLAAWLTVGSPAQAAEAASSYVVKATVELDGTLHVAATITFDQAPDSLSQVIDTATRTPDGQEYRFTISEVAATAGGSDLGAQLTQHSGSTTITVPTTGVTAPVELSYVVTGAAMASADGGTVVTWPLVQGLSVPVIKFDGTVSVAGPVQFSMIDCEAGDPASPTACTFYGGGTHDHPEPFFHHEGLAAGQFVQATLRFPAGSVTVNEDLHTLWTVERAFAAGPVQLGSALGLLVIGALALWLTHRRFGSDAGVVAPTPIAEFHPVGEGQSEFRVLDAVRPGHVGTVLDERVDPVDVTATLLDLAVRGQLRIEELERPHAHAATDWAFVRQAGSGSLAPYEQTLLDAVAPADGSPVRVSQLSAVVAPVVGTVQAQLYDDVVTRGWFARRPDTTRNLWSRIGWLALAVAVIATGLLAAFTSFGLVGLALVIVALGLLFVAAEMPARTRSGMGILGGLRALAGSLATQPTDQLPHGREYQQLSRILPYAVVLGGTDRWLQAIADADRDDTADSTDLTWYHAPTDWHLSYLPDSIRNFVTTVQGTLFSR